MTLLNKEKYLHPITVGTIDKSFLRTYNHFNPPERLVYESVISVYVNTAGFICLGKEVSTYYRNRFANPVVQEILQEPLREPCSPGEIADVGL